MSTQETWSPDTCAQPPCMVTMDVSTQPPTWVSTTQTCSVHTSLSSQALLNCLMSENVMKNNAVNQFPIMYLNQIGSVMRSGSNIAFSLSGTAPNRTLSIVITGTGVAPNAVTKSTMQTNLNASIATVTITSIA